MEHTVPTARCNLIATAFIFIIILFPLRLFSYERVGPFPHIVQNPAYLQHISIKPMSAKVLSECELEFQIISEYSNIFERGGTSSDFVDLDMEIWRIELDARRGMGKNFELFLRMPFYHMSGGFLDGFVQDFHNFFGFPNAGREQVPNGRFRYQLVKGGQSIFNYPPVTFLPGDLNLGFRKQVFGEGLYMPAMTFTFAARLPSAPDSRGIGADGLDFLWGMGFEKGGNRWAVYFDTAYALMSTYGTDEEFFNSTAWQYSLGGEIIISRSLSFLAQMVGGTPQLDGIAYHEWSGWPLDFIAGFGGRIDSSVGNWGWKVGFAEDITSEGPSVDFTVFMSVSWVPATKLKIKN